MGTLYKLFTDKDAEMLEINPLIVSNDGDLVCLDAKMLQHSPSTEKELKVRDAIKRRKKIDHTSLARLVSRNVNGWELRNAITGLQENASLVIRQLVQQLGNQIC